MANFKSSTLTCLALCLIFFVSTGAAIKCYICNSLTDSGCSGQANNKYLKDCSELVDGSKYTLCRKIDQDVPPEDGLDTKTRTIRECGWEDSQTACYQKAGFGGRQYVCSCTTDGCNGSSGIKFTFATLTSVVIVALVGPKFIQ